MEKLRTALDTRDRLAEHVGDPDHHATEANEVGAVAELTAVDEQFCSDSPPNREQLRASLDIKDHLAAHGITLPPGEALWREELEEAVEELK